MGSKVHSPNFELPDRQCNYFGTGWSGVSSFEIAVMISLLGCTSGGEAGLSDIVAASDIPVVGSYAVVVYIPQYAARCTIHGG
jgi:hypothetical protein